MLDTNSSTITKDEVDFLLENDKYISCKERKRLSRYKNKKLKNEGFEEKTKVRLLPKTEAQERLIKSINTKLQTIVTGPAGTGKTYVTALLAIDMLDRGVVDTIVLTRPNVPTGKSIGFFPGTLEEKMSPWVAPIFSVFREVMSQTLLDFHIKKGNIKVIPFETIRGHSFKNSFVMLDEAQNTNEAEMKALLTRIGEDSVFVINGDVRQSDVKGDSGLTWAWNQIEKHPYLKDNVGTVQFSSKDVVRSGLCKAWVEVIG